ncbi:hypothetical protein, partial [Actinotignum sanguinis]
MGRCFSVSTHKNTSRPRRLLPLLGALALAPVALGSCAASASAPAGAATVHGGEANIVLPDLSGVSAVGGV